MTTRNLTLVAAVVLVVTVVGGVLVFAVPRPPALPELAAATELDVDPGRLAWSSWEGDGRCLIVIDADGERTRTCDVELDGEVVGWEDGQVLVTSYATTEARTVRVDPDTGASRSVSEGEEGSRPSARAELTLEREDGHLRVEVEGVTVWQVDAPGEYTISWAQIDTAGELVLLADRAGRLLLVPADGSAEPQVWVDDVSAWQEVAWERAGT